MIIPIDPPDFPASADVGITFRLTLAGDGTRADEAKLKERFAKTLLPTVLALYLGHEVDMSISSASGIEALSSAFCRPVNVGVPEWAYKHPSARTKYGDELKFRFTITSVLGTKSAWMYMSDGDEDKLTVTSEGDWASFDEQAADSGAS